MPGKLIAWRPLAIDGAVFLAAWQAQDRFGFNWWDCLIVAAVRLSECDFILTEDLQQGQNLEGIAVLNPFEVARPTKSDKACRRVSSIFQLHAENGQRERQRDRIGDDHRPVPD